MLNPDAFTLNFTAGLILLICGHLDNSSAGGLFNLPVADLADELFQRLTVPQVEPLLEDVSVDLAEGLADLDGNADAHELLKPGDVRDQVRVQVIRVQGRPELSVLGRLEEGGETGELLDGFDKVGVVRGLRVVLGG